MTTIVSAVVLGIGVLLAGNLPWVIVLAPLNLRLLPTLPWAIAPMAVYLWLYWRFAGGAIGPRDSAAFRRASLRANPLSPDVWGMALFTGFVGFGALVALIVMMAELVVMPASQPIVTPANMPPTTTFALIAMSSVVAGVTEEAGFRGYMQGPIEQHYGIVAGVLINGAMFGLLHAPNHPHAVLSMLPYYMAVAGVYGGIVWATDSILPAVALHVGGDVWSLGRLWLTGQPEWVLSDASSQPASAAGSHSTLFIAAAALVILSILFVMLCRTLRQQTRAAMPSR